MALSLLFIPDISGFTKFVQNTEIAHSQHVISELLEVLIKANTQNLRLAEVEGDALFFFKENEIMSQEKLLAQMETMFTAFYSHLKLLEKNRICPCNACATAPDLQLKIIAHCGDLEFITVQGKQKPFGESVIQAHRLLKNSIKADKYALISKDLAKAVGLSTEYASKLYSFKEGTDSYDQKEVRYLFSEIDKEKLKLTSFPAPDMVTFDCQPAIVVERSFNVSAAQLLELVTNYSYRYYWVKGVDKFEYNPDEVTRLGTEHVCVVDGKRLNFTTVTKWVEPGKLIYGESTQDIPLDQLYQFYTFIPVSDNSCQLLVEVYPMVKSIIKKIMLALLVKRTIRKSLQASLDNLKVFSENNEYPLELN